MKEIDVGATAVPALGFGTWQLEGQRGYEAVRTALEVGYRHIDTAQIYGNEEQVGRALAESGIDRDEVFLTTKVWRGQASATDVHRSTEASLRRLGVDHVDLLLLHWPAEEIAPLEETLTAMDELRQAERTRLIGVSNFPSDLLRRAVALAPIVTDQVEYHPFLSTEKIRSVANEHGLFVTAYSPIAQGEVLTDETLRAIAAEHGRTPVQVTLRWLLQHDRVAAIPRSASREHIVQNAEIFDFELSDDEVARIDHLAHGRRLLDPPFAPVWDE